MVGSVSYTHLDVYKRQVDMRPKEDLLLCVVTLPLMFRPRLASSSSWNLSSETSMLYIVEFSSIVGFCKNFGMISWLCVLVDFKGLVEFLLILEPSSVL